MYKLLLAMGLLAGLLSIAARANDSTSAPPVDLRRLSEEIVSLASRGESNGFTMLRQQEIAPASDEEWATVVQNCERELRAFQEKFGRFRGAELVDERNIKSTFRRYTYIAKYEKNALVWTFVFYRPSDTWKLHSWNFNQNLDLLFRSILTSDATAPRGKPAG